MTDYNLPRIRRPKDSAPEETRICRVCAEEKLFADFVKKGSARLYQCKACRAADTKRRYHADPEGRAYQMAYSMNGGIEKRTGEKTPYVDPALVVEKILHSPACHYCGLENADSGRGFCVDHYRPIKLGGLHALENLVICCEQCNRAKHDSPPEAFISWLEGVRERPS